MNKAINKLLSLILPGCLLMITSCAKEDSMQDRLNNGESPFEIFLSLKAQGQGVNSREFCGKSYQGGLITYLDENTGSGLIVSNDDLADIKWGCFNQEVQIPNVFLTADIEEGSRIGDGLTNTLAILEEVCSNESAAKACNDYINEGFTDWFLPSRAELKKMDGKINNAKGLYWSSTAADEGIDNGNDYELNERSWAVYINEPWSCSSYIDFGITFSLCVFAKERNKELKVRAFRAF